MIRYRNRDGVQGVDVVVPLVTADGTALLVDRGWLETDPSGADRDDIPDPPDGEVDVTGYVRANGSGDSTRVADLSARAISSDEIGPAIGHPVYGGFVELRSEDPEPDTALEPVELPELNNGPHFFYGLQWWFFGVLAIFGFFYLLYDEWRNGPRGERLVRVQKKPQAEVEGPAPGGRGQGADRPREGRAGEGRPLGHQRECTSSADPVVVERADAVEELRAQRGTSPAAALATACSRLRAPGITVVTPGCCQHQASAAWAGLGCAGQLARPAP